MLEDKAIWISFSGGNTIVLEKTFGLDGLRDISVHRGKSPFVFTSCILVGSMPEDHGMVMTQSSAVEELNRGCRLVVKDPSGIQWVSQQSIATISYSN